MEGPCPCPLPWLPHHHGGRVPSYAPRGINCPFWLPPSPSHTHVPRRCALHSLNVVPALIAEPRTFCSVTRSPSEAIKIREISPQVCPNTVRGSWRTCSIFRSVVFLDSAVQPVKLLEQGSPFPSVLIVLHDQRTWPEIFLHLLLVPFLHSDIPDQIYPDIVCHLR